MATVKDPVCGMLIDSESAQDRRAVREQTYYFFCSSVCVTAFDADPERYLSQEAESPLPSPLPADERLEAHEPPYTTSGILTSPKFGAAGSGGLEYERLPEAHD